MTDKQFIEAHAKAVLREKPAPHRSAKRARQLQRAWRHVLCCWILGGATDRQLLEICMAYDKDLAPLGPHE